jgi:predicted nucleic acid-binding protein
LIVVDTNIIAYYLLQSNETTAAVEVRKKDNHWTAPGLWRSEFRNMLLRYIRSGDMDPADAKAAVTKAKGIVRVRSVSSDRVMDLAVSSGCTAYDCEFVSLAERLRIPLVTSDKQVLMSFPAIAVSMFDFLAL